MAPSLLGRLFRQAPAAEEPPTNADILRDHTLLLFTESLLDRGGAAVGRSHGVILTLHDCAGGGDIDQIGVCRDRNDDGDGDLYRCQVCERLFVMRFEVESRGKPRRKGDGDAD